MKVSTAHFNNFSQLRNQNLRIIAQNSKMQDSLNELTKDLKQAQLAGEARFDTTFLQPMEGFPLSTLEDFNRIEDSTEIREKLVSILLCCARQNCRIICIENETHIQAGNNQ